MTDLTVRQAAGQVLVGGFEGLSLPDEVADALAEGRLGGIVLFRRNIETLEQVVALNEAIAQQGQPVVPWSCIDQEGGRVVRVTEALGATPIPPMARLGASATRSQAAAIGEVIATEVSALGFNLNFAPVLDVDTNPDNPIIGDRAFSADPARVAELGGAVVVGHLIAGVVPCGKHFPGHGDTDVDSHVGLPVLRHERARLDAVELAPFRQLIGGGVQVPMLMTAHILLPALDPDHPATLSERVIKGLLRRELGYRGVVVSDDLEMEAVAARYEIEEMVTRGLRAGVDMFLICHQPALWTRAWETLVREAESSTEFRDALLAAANRVVACKRAHLPEGGEARFVRQSQWRELVGASDHRAVVESLDESGVA